MKKFILSLGAIAFLSLTATAQRNPNNPVETGMKIGGNMSTLSGENGQDYKPGVHVGAFVEYPLSYYKKFALQLELMYSMQGYKGIEYDQYDLTTYKINGTERLEDVTHHYLYLPLQVKYYVSDNFSVELGGQVGYMVAASGQYDMNRYNPVRNLVNPSSGLEEALFEAGYRSNKPKDFYEMLDYGVTAGFSVYLNSGFFISGRYYYGLQDVYKLDNDDKKVPIPAKTPGMTDEMYQQLIGQVNFINQHVKTDPLNNSVIQVSVGYRF